MHLVALDVCWFWLWARPTHWDLWWLLILTVVLHLNLYDLISLCIFHICIVILSVSFVNISSPQPSGYSTGGLLKAALELQKWECLKEISSSQKKFLCGATAPSPQPPVDSALAALERVYASLRSAAPGPRCARWSMDHPSMIVGWSISTDPWGCCLILIHGWSISMIYGTCLSIIYAILGPDPDRPTWTIHPPVSNAFILSDGGTTACRLPYLKLGVLKHW